MEKWIATVKTGIALPWLELNPRQSRPSNRVHNWCSSDDSPPRSRPRPDSAIAGSDHPRRSTHLSTRWLRRIPPPRLISRSHPRLPGGHRPTCRLSFASLSCMSPRTTTKTNLPSLKRVYINALAVFSLGHSENLPALRWCDSRGSNFFKRKLFIPPAEACLCKAGKFESFCIFAGWTMGDSMSPDAMGKKVSLSLPRVGNGKTRKERWFVG
jgi:hypothetical protein